MIEDKEICAYFRRRSGEQHCVAAIDLCTCDGNKWYCDFVKERKHQELKERYLKDE